MRDQRRYDETFAAMLRSLQTGSIGEIVESPVWTRKAPYPPIRYPSSNPHSVPLLGKRGINTILGFSFRSPTIEETAAAR